MTALKSPPAPKATGIEARCVATGMRMTEQRRVIARVLAEALDHPDVEELYRRCVAVDDKISISTVYRTVKLFEDAGIIERHDFREGRARYEQMRDSHHDHLINLRDGKVIEFTNEEIEKLQAEIARKLGYRLVDHRLELYCVPLDDDKISISTVYRTVKLFEDAGIIERHDFREGRARYEQMRDSHHDHLINLRDGKVIEFTSEEIEKLQAEVARKLGYKLVDHRLELYCVPLDDDKS